METRIIDTKVMSSNLTTASIDGIIVSVLCSAFRGSHPQVIVTSKSIGDLLRQHRYFVDRGQSYSSLGYHPYRGVFIGAVKGYISYGVIVDEEFPQELALLAMEIRNGWNIPKAIPVILMRNND